MRIYKRKHLTFVIQNTNDSVTPYELGRLIKSHFNLSSDCCDKVSLFNEMKLKHPRITNILIIKSKLNNFKITSVS